MDDGSRCAAGAGDGSVVHAIPAALAVIQEAVHALLDARSWSLSDRELREVVEQAAAVRSSVDAAWLSLVKALDDRPEAVPGASPGFGAQRFLTDRLHLAPGAVAADVAAARALDPEVGSLPVVGAALAAGQISRAHADAAVRVARDLPRRVASKVLDDGSELTGLQAADRFLAEQAGREAPRTVEWLGEQILARLVPERAERFDRDAVLRRTAGYAWDSTGMLRLRGQLAGAEAVEFCAVWDALSGPAPQGQGVDRDGQQVLVRDDRSKGMRQADGLCAMARLAAANVPSEAQGSAPGHAASTDAAPADAAPVNAAPADAAPLRTVVAVSATAEQVALLTSGHDSHCTGSSATDPGPNPASNSAGGVVGLASVVTGRRGPIPAGLLSRLACDAGLYRVLRAPSSGVLDLGRAVRYATAGQRRAVAVRDGGCARPGCTAPPQICDVHHLLPWSAGGGTGLDNLVMLCPRDHTGVHAGHWTYRMIDGVPWATPPAWVDPQRRPVRNLSHETAHRARLLGEQLRLLLDDQEHSARDRPP